MSYIKLADVKDVAKVKKALSKNITADGGQPDGGIIKHFNGFLAGKDPFKEFYYLTELFGVFLENFSQKDFHESFKSSTGFCNKREALARLANAYTLFDNLTNWRVARAIHMSRLESGKVDYSVAELESLVHYYVNGKANNDSFIPESDVLLQDEEELFDEELG